MTDWSNNDFTQYIKPPGAFPEGFDVAQYLQSLLYRFGILPPEDHYRDIILDMFCGKGRCAPAVPLHLSRCYRGVDINENAIGFARAAYPDYQFDVVDAEHKYWHAKCILLWTAVSMLDDANIMPFLLNLDARYIIIGEICGRVWRHAGGANHPPIYNRDYEEYEQLMHAAGYELMHHEFQPHVHYSDGNWNGRDTNMHTFIFHKDDTWQFYKEAHGKVSNCRGEPCQM